MTINKNKDFELEEVCTYTTTKGEKGWVIKVRPQVDHGVDVCGDEWDEEPVIYEKKFDPKHPYCTNWQ